MSNTKTSINSNKVNNTSTFEQWKDLTNEMATVFQSTVTMGATVGNQNVGNIILDGNVELATGHHLKADKILAAEGTSVLTVEEDVSILGDLRLNQVGAADASSILQYQKGASTNTWHIKTDVDHSELIIGTSDRSFTFNDNGTITTPAGASNKFTISNSLLCADISGVTIGANSQTTGAFTTLSATGGFTGDVTGSLTGNVTGDVKADNGTTVLDSGANGNTATFTGDIKATNGTVVLDNGTGSDASFTGNVTGNVTGNTSGTHTGAVTGTTVSASGGFSGSLTGNTSGTHTGAVTGTTVSASGGFSGNLTGVVTGSLDGNATSATAWANTRTIGFTSDSDLTGSWAVNGTASINSNIQVKDNSHLHTVANISDMDSFVDGKVGSLVSVDRIWPIGSIFISTSSANPSGNFGGNWEAFGGGKCLVGVGTGFTGGQTGGEYTHKLTTAQMPSHSHNHTTRAGRSFSKNGKTADNGVTQGSNGVVLDTWTEATTNTGGNNSFDIMQPYIAVYMWKRVPQ
jgi:microcystin-dependent protein